MASRHACKTCTHYDPYDGGLDVNTNGDVVGGIDSNVGQCLGLGHIVEVKEADTCPHWEADPLDKWQQARLEADVVRTALAHMGARDAYEQMARTVWPSQYDAATVRAVYLTQTALDVATSALLAFLGEGTDGK